MTTKHIQIDDGERFDALLEAIHQHDQVGGYVGKESEGTVEADLMANEHDVHPTGAVREFARVVAAGLGYTVEFGMDDGVEHATFTDRLRETGDE